MTDSLVVSPACVQDIPQLVAIMNATYFRKKTPAYFSWQYFDSVFPSRMICARRGEVILGMFGIQRKRLLSGRVIGQALDFVILPPFRGKGIFRLLAETALSSFSDLEAVCVFPNANGRAACEKSLGWKTLGTIHTMVFSPAQPLPHSDFGISSGAYGPFESFFSDASIHDWRFSRHPEYVYASHQGNASGKIVTKIFTDPVTKKRYGDIVSYPSDFSDETGARASFSHVLSALCDRHVAAVTTWALPHAPFHAEFLRLGFRDVAAERYFCVFPIRKSADDLTHFTRWHLMQSDTEVY